MSYIYLPTSTPTVFVCLWLFLFVCLFCSFLLFLVCVQIAKRVYSGMLISTQIHAIKSMPKMEKSDMLRALDTVEDSMKKHWQDHEGFTNLQERILALRLVLEEVADKELKGKIRLYR